MTQSFAGAPAAGYCPRCHQGYAVGPHVCPAREVYVFFWKRPIDPKPWPLVFEDRELAEKHPHRCSPVVAVNVDVGKLI